jgi:Ca2+-binding RTX toxin-like protein
MRYEPRAALVALATFLAVVSVPTPAYADGHCSFDEASAALTVPGEAVIVRAGDEIHVDGAPCVDETTDASATVMNTDGVFLTENGGNLTIDLRGGPFAPGKTAELTGDSEIEFTVDETRQTTTFAIEGTGGPDFIRAASLDPGLGAVMLNAAEGSGDYDVMFPMHAFEFLILTSYGGDDRVYAHGDGETPYLGQVWAWTGSGDDHLMPPLTEFSDSTQFVAGPGNDTLNVSWLPRGEETLLELEEESGTSAGGGYAGGLISFSSVETLIGHNGRDALYGSDGPDRLLGLGGSDVLHGRDGDDSVLGGSGADRIRGGTGVDRCDGRRNDVLVAGCERHAD